MVSSAPLNIEPRWQNCLQLLPTIVSEKTTCSFFLCHVASLMTWLCVIMSLQILLSQSNQDLENFANQSWWNESEFPLNSSLPEQSFNPASGEASRGITLTFYHDLFQFVGALHPPASFFVIRTLIIADRDSHCTKTNKREPIQHAFNNLVENLLKVEKKCSFS